jgi:hypothetical protein
MSPSKRPVSLVAEKAIRYLSRRAGPVGSVEMASEILSTRVADEGTARKVLEAAFAGDPRLRYAPEGWQAQPGAAPSEPARPEDPPHLLLLVEGGRRARGAPFEMRALAAVRVEAGEVVSACGGAPSPGRTGRQLRKAVVEMLDGAIPVWFDPPGACVAVESWLEEPLPPPVSLRLLARRRVGPAAARDLETLAAKLGLSWLGTTELLDQAEVLEQCLRKLRAPGENLADLRGPVDGAPPIDWSRFAFDRAFLREVPETAGTYRFFDDADRLIYVGKAKNLRARIGSYFREGAPRPARVQRLLEALHRIELEPLGSDLEALLREAAHIRREKPAWNVQRKVRPRWGRRGRLSSVLILEPAVRPLSLRAYLLRDGCLVGNVGIGPRGAGLSRIERILEDHFFGAPVGPSPAAGPEVEVEVVSRWLALHRDRVVAFDPTDLGSAREVVRRLRWFLERGRILEPDGTPIRPR